VTRAGAWTRGARRSVPVLLWTAFIIWPADGWGILRGIPVGPAGVAAGLGAALGVGVALHRGAGAAQMLPLAAALTQLAAVVIIFPHVYVDRLILPLYVLLLPYCALALDAISRRRPATVSV
jgi:hypothetical protein